jgi:anti-sigma-K factor RskA
MTLKVRRHDWRIGVRISKTDPRFLTGVLMTTGAFVLGYFYVRSHTIELKGIYLAGVVGLLVTGLPQCMTTLAEHAREEVAHKELAQKEAAAQDARVREERDETRRMCLMAIAEAWRSPAAAATAIHALTYHSCLMDAREAQGLMISIRSNSGSDSVLRALERYADRLSEELDQSPMFAPDRIGG